MSLPSSTRISQCLAPNTAVSIVIPWQTYANQGQGGAASGNATYAFTTPAAGAITGTAAARYAELLDALDRLVGAGLATVS